MAVSVNIGPELEAFIEKAVTSGRYGSRSEVLREGLRLVQEREAQWTRFDAEMELALDQYDAGDFLPLDEAFAEVRAAIDEVAVRRAA